MKLKTGPSSARNQLHSGFHVLNDVVELPEYKCPFCFNEGFNVLTLFSHIDQDHPVEAQNPVCPVCGERIEVDIAEHLTVQHWSILKVERKGQLRRARSMDLSALLNVLQERNAEPLFSGSSSYIPPSTPEPDPLLSSSTFAALNLDVPSSILFALSAEENLAKSDVHKKHQQRKAKLSDEDLQEETRKSEFVQQLLRSTIFYDES